MMGTVLIKCNWKQYHFVICIDQIYVPVKDTNMEWYLMVVNLEKQSVYHLDSNFRGGTNIRHRDNISQMVWKISTIYALLYIKKVIFIKDSFIAYSVIFMWLPTDGFPIWQCKVLEEIMVKHWDKVDFTYKPVGMRFWDILDPSGLQTRGFR